jgi:small subunit ribosomal protein S21
LPGIEITVTEGEPIEIALKRFKRLCEQSGLKAEIRRHEYYEKPSVKKKRKMEIAKRNARRKMKRNR